MIFLFGDLEELVEEGGGRCCGQALHVELGTCNEVGDLGTRQYPLSCAKATTTTWSL